MSFPSLPPFLTIMPCKSFIFAKLATQMKYFLKVKINLSQSQKYLIPKYNEIHLFFYGKIRKMSPHQNAINLSPKGEFLRTHRVGPICLSALFYFVYCSKFFYPEDLSLLLWWRWRWRAYFFHDVFFKIWTT